MSRTQYLPPLPDSWRVLPAKALFTERREISDSDAPHLTPSQHYGVVTQSDYMRRTGSRVVQVIEGGDNMKVVQPDDFILHLRSFQGGIERSTLRGRVSPAYTVLTPTTAADAGFYRWILKSQAYVQELRTTTNQLRDGQSIKFSQFASVPLPAPPLAEQAAIAAYLDRETVRIDALIAKQKQLITTLRERRTSTVTQLALAGLDPNVPMTRHSFLGDIPAAWKSRRFSRAISISGGQVDPHDEAWQDAILVAPNHVESGTGRITGRETVRQQGADSGKYVVKAGQILYSKIRPSLNKVTIAREDGLCSSDMYAMTASSEYDHEYLLYYFLSRPFVSYATMTSMRVKMPKINREELSEAVLPLPPLREQRQIANAIKTATSHIDTLATNAERFIELSKERRAALITAAVTGQLDIPSDA